VIDGHGLGRHAAHQREVAFLDALLGEGAFELLRGTRTQTEDEHAARTPVETVGGVHPLPSQLASQIEGGDAIGSPATVHDQACWLVDDQERVVPIQNTQVGDAREHRPRVLGAGESGQGSTPA
jgi:hypothetical protein